MYLLDLKEEHSYVSDGGAESGQVLVAVARIKSSKIYNAILPS